VFDRQRLQGTRFVRFKGEWRLRANGERRSWPLPVVYYNLLRYQQKPEGRAEMVRIPGKWLPIWQGLLEVATGALTPPLWVTAALPEGMTPLAQRLLDNWRLALWVRQ
jgi:hypothetical protein